MLHTRTIRWTNALALLMLIGTGHASAQPVEVLVREGSTLTNWGGTASVPLMAWADRTGAALGLSDGVGVIRADGDVLEVIEFESLFGDLIPISYGVGGHSLTAYESNFPNPGSVQYRVTWSLWDTWGFHRFDPVPGAEASARWDRPRDAHLNRWGEMVFRNTDTGGLYRLPPRGEPVLVARPGQFGPASFSSQFRALGLNDAGQALVYFRLSNLLSGGTAVIQIVELGGTTTIARGGDAAPGGGVLSNDGPAAAPGRPSSAINNAGQVVMSWPASGSFPAGPGGIYRHTPTVGLEAVARQGWFAPGTGVQYGELGADPVIAADGAVVFPAVLSGLNITETANDALFVGEPGAVEAIMVEGRASPVAGWVFRGPARRYAAVGGGVVLFQCGLFRSEQEPVREGVFRWRPDGSVETLLVRGGDLVVDGQSRRVTEFWIAPANTGLEDGRETWASATGEVIAVVFLDGSDFMAVRLGERACAADINGDGAVNFFDVSAFLTAYGQGSGTADFEADGVLNFFDVSAFLGAYGAGCS